MLLKYFLSPYAEVKSGFDLENFGALFLEVGFDLGPENLRSSCLAVVPDLGLGNLRLPSLDAGLDGAGFLSWVFRIAGFNF